MCTEPFDLRIEIILAEIRAGGIYRNLQADLMRVLGKRKRVILLGVALRRIIVQNKLHARTAERFCFVYRIEPSKIAGIEAVEAICAYAAFHFNISL